jgi:hypothetical protein
VCTLFGFGTNPSDINRFDSIAPISVQTPAFLRKHGFKDISDLEKNPTIDVYGSNFFEELSADPRREANFASAMSIQDAAPSFMFPTFPYSESFDDFQDEVKRGGSEVFLVDVGGGKGQYLNRLLKEVPGLPGRKIFQDLPSVIANVDHNETAAEPMGHDFFTPQPVKGAKFYHFRGIMHDWPDDSCIKIISQLRPSFRKGYSRLLIQSFVLPNTGCSLLEATSDLTMWACCGMERAENHWHSLLERAGFKIVRIIRAEVGSTGMIEAEMVADSES